MPSVRARLWRAGRPAPVDWLGLLAIPRRYFVDLHHVVARDPFIARTHIAVAGGAIAALALGELSASKLVSTPGAPSFAEELFAQMHYGFTSDLAARCLVLLGMVWVVGSLVAGGITSRPLPHGHSAAGQRTA